MKSVFLLRHCYIREEGESSGYKNLGVFSSMEKLNKHMENLKTQKGFINYPNDFEVWKYIINKSYHQESIKFAEEIFNVEGFCVSESEFAKYIHEYSLFELNHYFTYKDKNNDGYEEWRVLGYYSSWKKGQEAKSKFKLLPGFKDLPDDSLYLRGAILDKRGWKDGFITRERNSERET